jgi:hypothetical protein
MEQSKLHQKLLDAISQNVTVITNYWGEFEEISKESLINAAKACEQILNGQTDQVQQPDEIKEISIKFAEWMHNDRLTGSWNENYEYFLKNIYKASIEQPIAKPALINGLRNAK